MAPVILALGRGDASRIRPIIISTIISTSSTDRPMNGCLERILRRERIRARQDQTP